MLLILLNHGALQQTRAILGLHLLHFERHASVLTHCCLLQILVIVLFIIVTRILLLTRRLVKSICICRVVLHRQCCCELVRFQSRSRHCSPCLQPLLRPRALPIHQALSSYATASIVKDAPCASGIEMLEASLRVISVCVDLH